MAFERRRLSLLSHHPEPIETCLSNVAGFQVARSKRDGGSLGAQDIYEITFVTNDNQALRFVVAGRYGVPIETAFDMETD